jgi:hypothetical protein
MFFEISDGLVKKINAFAGRGYLLNGLFDSPIMHL